MIMVDDDRGSETMITLALDTSTVVTVGVARGLEVLAVGTVEDRMSHAEQLMPLVDHRPGRDHHAVPRPRAWPSWWPRLSVRFNLIMLLLFTAGNLLPQQILLAPLFKIYTNIQGARRGFSGSGELYDSILRVVTDQHRVPDRLLRVRAVELHAHHPGRADRGRAGRRCPRYGRQYWRITMPLCRPALAALATLLTTWIYNDFFWALTLMSTGDKLPITSAIKNLQGRVLAEQRTCSRPAR